MKHGGSIMAFYETATAGRRSVNLERAKYLASPQTKRREKFLRDYRLRQLDELIKQHAGDKDYFASISAWRREKLDLLAQS
jgi:hypothetical protein